MKLFDLSTLMKELEIECNDALKQNFQSRIKKEISYEEYENQRLHYEGVKIGAEAMFIKVKEFFVEQK